MLVVLEFALAMVLLTAAGVRAHYHELPEPCDHAGLLAQARRLHGPLRDFLRRRS